MGREARGACGGARTLATSSDCTLPSSVEYGHGSAALAAETESDAASAAPSAADFNRWLICRSMAILAPCISTRRSAGPEPTGAKAAACSERAEASAGPSILLAVVIVEVRLGRFLVAS